MRLNRTGSIWNRNERININDNWDKLEPIVSSLDVGKLIKYGFYANGINMINPNELIKGKYVHYFTGEIRDNERFYATDFIPVVPGKPYFFEPMSQFHWYDSDKNSISGGSQLTGVTNPLIAPDNAYFIRLTIADYDLNKAMFYQSTEKMPYEPFVEPIKLMTSDDLKSVIERKYNVSQIYQEWLSGNKFPIMFLDDSQTDGNGTTGHFLNTIGTDHKPPNAYPTLLENEFKSLTSNNSLRIYNAGFSGTTAQWALDNFDDILEPYSDTKIVFIGFGTNDRIRYNTPTDLYTNFRKSLKNLVEKFQAREIQVVLMTEQPSVSPGIRSDLQSRYPLRTAGFLTITNKIKKDLAAEYNLELVDLTESLRKVVNGKESIPMTTIFNGNDRLHFGDGGHKLVKEVFLSEIYPFTLKVKDTEIIDLFSQYIENGVPEDKVTLSRVGKYTCYADYTVTADELMLKQAIYIDSFDKFTITCDTRTNSTVYMKLNGVKQSTNTVTVEPGYYLIEVMSGASRAGFNGITLEKAQE